MLKFKIIPVTAFQQNCSILWDDETMQAVVIDAGGEAEKLKQTIAELGLTVVALWNTHGHLDHIGAVGALAEHYNVPVIGPHIEDQFWVEQLQTVSAHYGFPIPEPVTVTQWLQGGETLQLGAYQFEVRYTPGHSPGHVIFYCAELDLAWVGDVIFRGSIGRTDLPRGDFGILINSIKTQVYTLPDETKFIAGHGEPSDIAFEKAHNPFIKG